MEKSSNISALVKEWSYGYTITSLPPFLGGWIFQRGKSSNGKKWSFPDVEGLFFWPLDRAKPLSSRLLLPPLNTHGDWLSKEADVHGRTKLLLAAVFVSLEKGRFSRWNSLFWMFKCSPTAAKPFPVNNRNAMWKETLKPYLGTMAQNSKS